MDGDLQHDESLLVPMLQRLRGDGANIVVASRYADGGSAEGLSSPRAWGSRMATRLARRLLHIELSDPMSGFFMLRRELVETIAPKLSTQRVQGPARHRGHRRRVLAGCRAALHVSRRRLYGESKLDAAVTLEYLGLLLAKATDDAVSLRFTLFCLVGAIGIGVHFLTLLDRVRPPGPGLRVGAGRSP